MKLMGLQNSCKWYILHAAAPLLSAELKLKTHDSEVANQLS